MDFICGRILFFCRNYSNSCKMWNPENGFGCGNGTENRCGICVFMDHGTFNRNNIRMEEYKWTDIVISCAVRTCYRSLLVMLFSCTSER